MKIYVGADHRGEAFKQKIIKLLTDRGHAVIDIDVCGPQKVCDYPKVAYRVAQEVTKSKDGRGILVCLSGIGQAIAANKVKGAYAALCYNEKAAALSRRHNNANILVLGADFVKNKDLPGILTTWLETEFEGGRHKRRVNQIKKIEKGLKV
jgi:RpiB/LacA/LacB family sugar-phosphate isomerase